ncbi:MAG: hypothetical protein E7D69_11935 [Clostridium celatum]|nr:hypothetical protein [Clostridium celatum]
MEGFNWWGFFILVVPTILLISVGFIFIVLSILGGIVRFLYSFSKLKGGDHIEKRKKRVA